MLTLFTTAKPFVGHSAIIQRNALKSWTLLHPNVEVILFGDDAGAAETARGVATALRTIRRAQASTWLEAARLYVQHGPCAGAQRHHSATWNCDIILMDDFLRALKRIREKRTKFLMVGRRWDIEMPDPVGLFWRRRAWRSRPQGAALMRGVQRSERLDRLSPRSSKGLYGASVPPLVVGRVHWDQWLMWKALDSGAAVVDASSSVIAVHQNHDYSYHPNGRAGVWHGIEADENNAVGGMWQTPAANFSDADGGAECDTGIRSNAWRHWSSTRRTAKTVPALRSLRRATAGRVLLFRHHAIGATRGGIAKRSAAKISAECASEHSGAGGR